MKTLLTIAFLFTCLFSKAQDYFVGLKRDTTKSKNIIVIKDSLSWETEAGVKKVPLTEVKFYKSNKKKVVVVNRNNRTTLVEQEPDWIDFMPNWPMKDGEINYNGVVSVDSASKLNLYSAGRKYYFDHYKSSKDVIQVDNSINGEILGRGNFKEEAQGALGFVYEMFISHNISISCKDGRYRYEISSINVIWIQEPTKYNKGGTLEMKLQDFNLFSEKERIKFFMRVDNRIKENIAELEKAMKDYVKNEW